MSDSAQHRPDIDGLRAFAVVMVLLYHAGIPGMSFGFWGVDCFLVISGYLITGNIAREAGEGGFSLVGFWARRIRRLIPAAFVVILATMGLAVLVGDPLSWRVLGSDAAFSSAYLVNFSYGLREASYFDLELESRPLLHMWSLSLEEQFYLLWPVCLTVLLRRGSRAARVGTLAVLAISFVLSANLSSHSPTPSYYLLPTRAWEFAAGGLLALVSPGLSSARGRTLLAGGGIAAFGLAAILLTPFTALPGTLSALPVLGTAAVIAAGRGAHGLQWVLTARPVAAVGRVSYSLYLWHWPILVLGRPVLGYDTTATLMLVAVSSIMAALSYAFVEKPLRYSRSLQGSTFRSYALAAGSVAILLACSFWLRSIAARVEQEPWNAELKRLRDETTFYRGCDRPSGCVLQPDGIATVLVLGDSHAMQWTPAIVRASRKLNMRVVFAGLGACSPFPVQMGRPERRDGAFGQCNEWHARLGEVVASVAPAVVLIAGYEGYSEQGAFIAGDGRSSHAIAALRDAAVELADLLANAGAASILVLGPPEAAEEPISCAARRGTFDGCESTMEVSLGRRSKVRDVVTEPFRERGAEVIDIADLVCPGRRCSMVVNGVPVYRDKHHVSRTFSMTTAGLFEDALRNVSDPKPANSSADPSTPGRAN